ncbi:TetR/AcrR family transcriptional regulator [Janthinobacterium sp.]|uniref:TetR/AcrR family transcriptional regulator n=1 Tax=Janthinobacterium sp. TaxID=1871054 RepID=UPI00293D5618|nr:TetR/AcrR family transcriptional regulator [Janthinobacterium sp.]
MHLFWRNGYEGTSVAELTAALGITPPSLYAAFGSKELLYREALERYLSSRGTSMMAALDQPGAARAAVAAMLERAAALFADDDAPAGCPIASGALRCGPENGAVSGQTASLRRLAGEAILQRVERARAEGELAPDVDGAALASFYATVVQGMSVQAIDGASRTELDAIAGCALAAWPVRP